MEHEPQSERHWMDVTMVEIQEDIAEGRENLARDKAKQRFYALWDVYYTDLQQVLAQPPGEIDMEDWKTKRKDLADELRDLGMVLTKQLDDHEVEEQLEILGEV